RYGAISRKASPKVNQWIDQFITRLDAILPWDEKAVDCSALVKKQLSELGTPIGANDIAIAGHAMAAGSIVVTNNTREFCRVVGLRVEDWVDS
ncbi:twitching motility protein PilT, partial [Oleiphilus sp. HI0072]